jgi:1,4-dihydroxy-2-naphthoyl-CoA hydrolase
MSRTDPEQAPGAGERTFDAARLTPTDAGAMMAALGIEWLEAGPDRVVARIPVRGNTQPYGILHGGATAALCETVASFGAALRAGPDHTVVGIELNVNHLRAVSAGHIAATGTPLHQGRTTAVWTMEVRDDEGRLTAVSRLTLAVRGPLGG